MFPSAGVSGSMCPVQPSTFAAYQCVASTFNRSPIDIDPAVILVKEGTGILPQTRLENIDATGMIMQVRRYVVNLAMQRYPGIVDGAMSRYFLRRYLSQRCSIALSQIPGRAAEEGPVVKTEAAPEGYLLTGGAADYCRSSAGTVWPRRCPCRRRCFLRRHLTRG